ncbi:MAG TPA: prolyl oligopeptidase family serine peptidase [Chloroflexota bacterium]|nr:prolyl oligopeptidase family serine peptidase [Chloroflexota bacterium]
MSSFREVMVRLLGRWPERCDLEARVEERVEVGDVVRERVTYQVEAGERVPAYVFVPAGGLGGRAWSGIFAHHQHAGEFHLGKSEVAGLAGNAEQAYALELAQRGHVVLAPDAIAFEERGAYGGSLESPADRSRPGPGAGQQRERFEFTKRILTGSCLQTKMVWDMQRGLDYLASRAEVDPDRLGCIGHSLGGQQTLFLAALDPRVKAAVSSCGFASMRTVLRDGINHNFGAYVPDWLSHGDVGDLLGAAAPCAFLAFNGEADRIFPIDGVHETFAVARGAYEAVDAGDRLALRVMPGGHQFSDAMRQEAYAWLERWLAA